MTWCTTSRVPGRTSTDLHPFVLGEVRRNLEVLVLDEPIGRAPCSRPASADDRVRLCRAPSRRRTSAAGAGPSDRPSARRCSPSAGCIAFSSSRQAALVGELPVGLVGVPRRHDAGDDLVADVLRVRPRVLVGEERHRRDFARPVTARAVLVEDRRDILRERRDAAPDRAVRAAPGRRAEAHDAREEQDRWTLRRRLTRSFACIPPADGDEVLDSELLAGVESMSKSPRPPASEAVEAT